MRNVSGTPILMALGVIASATVSFGQSATVDSKSQILAARAAWNKAMTQHDADAVSSLLAPDFSAVHAAHQRRGMVAERNFLRALFKSKPDVAFTRKPTRVAVDEAWGNATEQGTWTERWAEKDGTTALHGTYFVFWRRINGTWKQQADVFVPETCKGGSYCAPNEPRVITESPEDVLRNYAGSYEMTDGSVLEIKREGAYLVAQGQHFNYRVLTPKSHGEFSAYTPRREWEPTVARFVAAPLSYGVKPTRRNRLVKRASWRKGSSRGSTLSFTIPEECS